MNATRNIIIFIFFITCFSNIFGQEVEYTYDASGNRIQRKVVVLRQQSTTNEKGEKDVVIDSTIEDGDENELQKNTVKSNEQKLYEEQINDITVSVFPNPAQNTLFYAQPNGMKTTIEIRDYRGKLLDAIPVNTSNKEIDIQKYTKGTYIVRALSNGKYTEWIIVKN